MGTGSQPPTPTVEVAVAVPLLGDKLFVARRPVGTHLEGTWEFPGGKVARGEEPSDAVRRELLEETGLVGGDVEPLLVMVHEYPDRTVRLHVYVVRDPKGEVTIDRPREWAWRTLAEARRLEMPPANAQILEALRWRLA